MDCMEGNHQPELYIIIITQLLNIMFWDRITIYLHMAIELAEPFSILKSDLKPGVYGHSFIIIVCCVVFVLVIFFFSSCHSNRYSLHFCVCMCFYLKIQCKQWNRSVFSIWTFPFSISNMRLTTELKRKKKRNRNVEYPKYIHTYRTYINEQCYRSSNQIVWSVTRLNISAFEQ